jgi:hypothetical protein
MKKAKCRISTRASARVTLLGCLLSFGLLLAGCGSGTVKPTSEQLRAFDAAPAEVKLTWNKALAAEQAKDYVVAQNFFESLWKMNLTSEQRQEFNAEFSSFQQKLYQTAENGDPEAIKAVKEIRNK